MVEPGKSAQTKCPFFSVIIPAYNASQHIRGTLDSVRLQTFGDYEIIVVNDGSRDETLEVVKAYFSDHPELNHKVIDQENRGIGGARNSGVREASGEFVAFLDADDRWYKEKLARVMSFIEKNPMYDLVCHDENWVKNGRNIKRVTYGPYKNYADLLFKGNCISTSATVVRRSKLLEAGLFSENLDFNGAEDYELWLRLSKTCKIAYLHDALGEYRIHDNGITSNTEKHCRNCLNVIKHHYEQWPRKSSYYNYLMRKREAKALRGGGKNLLETGDLSSAGPYLMRALSLNPLSVKTLILLCLYYKGVIQHKIYL